MYSEAMKNKDLKSKKNSTLRKIAEKKLKSLNAPIENLPDLDTRKLAHELQVHQMELEMQNEELKDAQKTIEDSRQQYVDLYDYAPVGYFTVDMVGIIHKANLTLADMLGKTRTSLINKLFGLFIVKEDIDIFYLHLQNIFQHKRADRCELSLKGNREIFAQLDSIYIVESGRGCYCRTAVTDISQRKRLEKEKDELSRYRRMEEQIRDLAKFPNENPNPVLRIAKDCSILYANEAGAPLLKTWNCQPEQPLPDNLCRLIHNILDTGLSLEIEAVCEDTVFCLNLVPVVSAGYVNIYGLDVTERKRMDSEILKLSTAVEQSPCVVVITDVNGNVEYANPKFTELTGYTIDETIGKNLYILKSGRQSQDVYNQLWSAITSGIEWHAELHNKKKNGEYYWEDAYISPIRDANGVITHFVKVAEDITRRKQVEEDLKKHHHQLEDIVDKRTRELKKAYDQLLHSEKLNAIGNLSASIAHEFNNPIFGILNVLERIKSDVPMDQDNMNFVMLAISECDRISKLIRGLNDFHRPSSGKKVLTDINKIIEDV